MNTKKAIVQMLIICLMLPVVLPILVFADSGVWSMECGNINIDLNIEPYENDLGLMVNAEDAAKVFSLDYEFDGKNKTFTINDEKNGKVVLMHNATQFYSGDKIYDCAPYFYAENTVPMVEMGFFCKMFGSSYEVKENKIIVYKNKLGDDVAKLIFDDITIPLYVEPHKTEMGFVTGVEDLAKAVGLAYTYNAETKSVILNDKTYGDVVLNDGAEEFTSSAGTFVCSPFYFVKDGVPMIEIGFFCKMYNLDYNYDEEKKTLFINRNLTNVLKSDKISLMSIDGNGYTTISGVVICAGGAPSGGLDVDLMLQQTKTRYNVYKLEHYVGETYNLGTVHLEQGETSVRYSYCTSLHNTDDYSGYSLFYRDTKAGVYGYYDKQGQNFALKAAPDFKKYYSNSKDFYFASSYKDINIDLDANLNSHRLSGNIILDNNISAPDRGVDVELILQTRSQRMYEIYTPVYYIGNTVNLGTVHIPKGEKSAPFNYNITYYYQKNKYPNYTLFYRSLQSDCVKPYGYVNGAKAITSTDRFNETAVYTDAYEFKLFTNAYQNLIIPVKQSYLDKMIVKPPTANYSSGSVASGTAIQLFCATEGAKIFYTTDGSIPTIQSIEYTEPITVNETQTIKAIAVKDGMENSNISQFDYIVDTKVGIIYGDVNGDGAVDRMDLLRLSKYFTGWDVAIDEKAADVNGDGAVNRSDLLRLSKYFTGWDVTLGSESDNK